MPEMTAAEAAEILDSTANGNYVNYDNAIKAMRVAASILRRVASGELAPVVHGYWIRKYDTLSQNYNLDENWYFICSKCGGADRNRAKYCHCCGALMGKDDGHE